MAGVQPCKPSSCAWTSNQAKGNIGELISIWAPYPQYTHRMEASTTYRYMSCTASSQLHMDLHRLKGAEVKD